MRKGIILSLVLLAVAGLAWAMAVTPVCFFSSANVCASVTLTNPLPAASN